MAKIKQYLEENAFSLIAIFTSNFVLSEFWEEWMHVTLGLKVWGLIIGLLYICAGTYIDVLRQTIKWNNKHIVQQADKIEELQRVKRHER